MSIRRPVRTVSGPTDRVVVVGAGLAGLACALHLAGTGRRVTVLEREEVPGGRAGRLSVDGYTFDTGPTVLTLPELIEDALGAVGERLPDWLDLIPVDPAYRALFPDGSSLDVLTDTRRMAEEVSRVCGPREADGYLRYVEYTGRLWRIQREQFIEQNLDDPRQLLGTNLLRLLAAGGFGRLENRVNRFFRDPRTQRVFSFQAMYAGLAPHQARALYAVISYLDTVGGVWFPRGGMHALPRAMAAAAEKHGVQFHYATEVEKVLLRGGRAVGVRTTAGEQIPADAVVLNPDLPLASSELLGTPLRRRLRYSPSCVVLHLGSARSYPQLGHHTILFGRAWRRTFDEVIRDGRLMTDPSLFVTNPTRTDPSLAPVGRHTYYVLAPAPNLRTAPLNWRDGLAERYAGELLGVLQQRGYAGLGDDPEVLRVITPQDWRDAGMAAGTPFAAAHTMAQTGPFRPSTLHPTIPNVVFTGSGTQPGVGVPMVLISGRLAAARITAARP